VIAVRDVVAVPDRLTIVFASVGKELVVPIFPRKWSIL